MLHMCEAQTAPIRPSELILSDRLIALAQEAERAGFHALAAHLVELACDDFADDIRQ